MPPGVLAVITCQSHLAALPPRVVGVPEQNRFNFEASSRLGG
jgi:hypothetical protein